MFASAKTTVTLLFLSALLASIALALSLIHI